MNAESTQIDGNLEPGTELELTYDGVHGERTITVYVLEAFDPYSTLDRDTVRVRAAEPDARRPRRVRFDIEQDDTLLKSLNSKASGGRKLGWLRDVTVTGATDETFRQAGHYYAAREGDVLRVDGERMVVVDDSHGLALEHPETGSTMTLRFAAHRGVYRLTDDYEREAVDVEATGETMRNGDAATVLEALADYGHGDRGAVEAVTHDGTRYDVVYRHDAREEGIRLASPDADASRRNFDTRLRLDPLGLRLATGYYTGEGVTEQRVDADDLELVYEGVAEQSEQDEEPELVADGGQEAKPEHHPEENTYPPAPEVRGVESRGVVVGEPREIEVTVSYWPRGADSQNTSTVRFSCRGMAAEIRDISGDGSWSEQLAAAAAAEEAVREHPQVEGVAGVQKLYRSERSWIDRCEAMDGGE